MISQLAVTLQEAPSLQLQLVDSMLKQQAACSIGSLVSWVQQQPEQQQLDVTAVAIAGQQGPAAATFIAASTTASIWAAGVQLMNHFAAAAFRQMAESATARNMAENLTQQLEQSGTACATPTNALHIIVML
jgi:hypothetical protein